MPMTPLTAAQRELAERAWPRVEVDGVMERKFLRGGDAAVQVALAECAKIPAPDYRARRAADYMRDLAKVPSDAGNFQRISGDVQDIALTQIAIILNALAITPTVEFADVMAKVAVIKAAHPKP